MNDPHSYPRPISKEQLVMGHHALTELLKHAPHKLLKVFTVQTKQSEILDECKKKNIPIVIMKLEQLTKMVESDSHQSIVAQIRPREYLDASEFLETAGEESFVLMLDQIFDPQNFGALIRSAECFGADAVAWSKNRGADLTPVAAKTSCGASELMPLIRVSNLATTVEQFQKEGFEVVTALLDPTAESAFGFSYAPRTVLVVGSEGEGIQPLIQKKADRSIYLPMSGKIESLNVAQATTALLALRASTK